MASHEQNPDLKRTQTKDGQLEAEESLVLDEDFIYTEQNRSW